MSRTRTCFLSTLGALFLLTGCESSTQPSEFISPTPDPGAIGPEPSAPTQVPGARRPGAQQPKLAKRSQAMK